MPVYLRRRGISIATKTETTSGTDAWGGAAPNAATDFIRADADVSYEQTQIADPSLTGSLDSLPPIIGGTKVRLTLTIPMRGSGTAGVAPRWGRLMAACAYQEQVTASPIAAAAATAGTQQTVTLGTGFAATAQAYRGMPITLSGNPATPDTTLVADYTAGKVATVTQKFATALSTSTMTAIPANVLYKPITDPTLVQTVSVMIFMDGIAWLVTGCVGSWSIDMTAAGLWNLKFTMTGVYNVPVAATAPTGIVYDAATFQPPIWRSGEARIGGDLARVSRMSVDCGNTLFEPENPEASEGYDASVITARAAKGTADPLMSVTSTIARVQALRQGATQTLSAVCGTVAGNSFGIVAPAIQYTGFSPQNRSELMAENLPFGCIGQDSALFLTVF